MVRIKQKLFKKINEAYFREFQDTEFEKVTLDDSSSKFLKNISIAYDLSTEFGTLVEDLYEIMYGPEMSPTLCSDYARELLKEQKDAGDLIRLRLKNSIFISDITFEVMDILKASSKSAIVGGFIRDSLIELKSKDVDFVTDIPYDSMEIMFEKAGFKVQSEGKQFLVLIVSKDGEQYEIANFRKDGTYKDGRRPEYVEIGTIEEDAERRDFTVNALYYNLTSEMVIDPSAQGLDDVKSKTLRFIGNPKHRLDEDTLRAFRFYRLLKTKKLFPHSKSLKAVRERIQQENQRATELQRVLKLPGVKEAINKSFGSTKMVKKGVNISFEELSKPIISLERLRLEVEKML